jgi:vancomycin resistance protein YoaR
MNLRKLIAVVVIMALTVAGLSCRKKPAQTAPQETEVKTQAEYDAQAKKEIDSNNMQAELERIEKQLQQEKKNEGF